MNVGFTLNVIIIVLLLSILIDFTIFLAVKYWEKKESSKLNLSFEDAFTVLGVIIQSELKVYDNDVFVGRGGITNANFDTYYSDISTKIIEKISPEVMESLKKYITEDAVYTYIARTVRSYLVDQITPSIPTNENV